MNQENNELDTIWLQIGSLATVVSQSNKQFNIVISKINKLRQRIERLESKELLSPVRVTVEFRNIEDATKFREYVTEENDVAIPVGEKPGEDEYIHCRLIN